MSHRFEGRNLDEALQTAAQALGVEPWQLTHHVLLQKRGFLGGFKRVVIEADVNKEAAPPPPAPAPLPPLDTYEDAQASAPAAAPSRERSGGSGRGRGARGGRRDGRGGGESRGGRQGGGRGRRPDHHGSELRVGDFETFLGDLPEQGSESDAAKLVRDWLEQVLAMSKLDVVLRTEENETQILVRLYGGDVRQLTDRHGELLDAIQVLANKALVGRKVEKEIELDAEEFKEKRTESIERKAFAAAERVSREGREELLPAMSPVERRIVHLALRDHEDVTTESRGDGFFKRVAVILRSEAEQQPQESQES